MLPRIGDYSAAWDLLRRLSLPETLLLVGMALLDVMSSAPVWTSVLPAWAWSGPR